MMTLYDFNAMNESDQAAAVFLKGIFLDDRQADGFKIQLYRIDSFYVEVFYDAAANLISHYRAFKNLGQLSPYVRLN